MDDRSSSVVNPSKHVQVYAENEKENSVSSTDANVKSFKGSEKAVSEPDALLGAGTDSENTDEQVEKEMNSEQVSPDNGVGDSSCEAKVESDEVKHLSTVKDPLVEPEAMDSLQDAGNALVPVVNSTEFAEDSISGNGHSEAAADAEERNVQETSLIAQSQSSSEVVDRFSENEDVEKESEQLLTNVTDAKVEIMEADALDQITLVKKQALASAMEELGDTLKDKAKVVEKVCEELAIATQSLKRQMKICRYLFLLIVSLLAFVFGRFILKSQSYVEYVPT